MIRGPPQYRARLYHDRASSARRRGGARAPLDTRMQLPQATAVGR